MNEETMNTLCPECGEVLTEHWDHFSCLVCLREFETSNGTLKEVPANLYV